jgi:thioredoxin-related protein
MKKETLKDLLALIGLILFVLLLSIFTTRMLYGQSTMVKVLHEDTVDSWIRKNQSTIILDSAHRYCDYCGAFKSSEDKEPFLQCGKPSMYLLFYRGRREW